MNFAYLFLFFLISCWSKSIVNAGKVVPNENDQILWNVTVQLDPTYDAYKQARLYHISFPSKKVYENVPVIMHFHGGFGCGAQAAQQSGLVAQAASLGFMIIFGEGYLMSNGGRKWSGGSCCGQCSTNSTDNCYVDDVKYVSGIIEDLLDEEYITAESPIFASGHSNGGILSYRLYCELGDKISGFAPTESAMGYYDADQCLVDCNDDTKLCYSSKNENCDENSWSTNLPEYFSCSKEKIQPNSILTFQGAKDAHVLIDGGKCTDENRCKGHFSTVPYNFQVERNAQVNGCDMTLPVVKNFYNESSTNKKDISECFSFQGCAKNTSYCIQYNGGHAWPGSTFDECEKNSPSYNQSICMQKQWLTGPTIESLHATELLVDFFKNLIALKDF